jgi:hypothetical protein
LEQQNQIRLTIAKIIREKSKACQLTQLEEILAGVTEQGLLKSESCDPGANLEAILRQVITDCEDLKEIAGENGIPHYYSSQSLTETYAGILVRKSENSLIAEIVRENSKIYPRPVPLDIFKESPFDLTQEDILARLRQMNDQEDYRDIAQTTTSIGTIFLYSNRHLDAGYASMLAEWIDVGQADNP